MDYHGYLRVLNAIAGRNANNANVKSLAKALGDYAERYGLNLPHRFAQFAAQVSHESGRFTYDREIWGPTPAQERYDTRTDLGNTPERDGDGYKNRGRGPIQLTGADNIARFENWCVQEFGRNNVPYFSADPDLINSDPWEGLSAIWYWTVGNPDRKSLNRYADEANNEMITRRINGGLNGYADRLDLYTQVGLAILGYPSIGLFQKEAKINGTYTGDLDGLDGPKTRAAIHKELVKLGHVPAGSTKAAPVTELEPVAPQGADKTAMTRTFGGAGIVSIMAGFFTDLPDYAKVALVGISLVAFIVLIWKAELIAARVRGALKAFGIKL